MTKKKLYDDTRQNPARIYRIPGDVLRDRRFSDGERLEILRAWRDKDGDPTADIGAMIVELEHRLVNTNHAAE
jgi:hypothetical protein